MNFIFCLRSKEASSDEVTNKVKRFESNTLFLEVNPADFPIPQTLNEFINEVNIEI